MSSSSRSSTDDSFSDIEELLHIEARCRELRREKDLLKQTQSQSFDLIKRVEMHLSKLNEARLEDKRQIQALEEELSKCQQEIDYLQDQLNMRNAEADVGLLEEEIVSLREELNKSNSECECLMQELETKDRELQKSNLHIEELEDTISSATLEYQCEIESMRLDMLALEQRCFEAKKSEEEVSQENARLSELLHELELRFEDVQKTVRNLEIENKQVKDMLDASEKDVKLFCRRVEEHFKGWIEESNEAAKSNVVSDINYEENKFGAAGEVCAHADILGRLLSKVLKIGTSDADLKGTREKMSCQLHEKEELVKQLKEELREEKLKAKEEAEDLAQEMAELRYQMTQLLEEERKRRACIEQASLQRISELEALLGKEQRKSVGPIHAICEAKKS